MELSEMRNIGKEMMNKLHSIGITSTEKTKAELKEFSDQLATE
ncbi:hypothetical protein [Candidatus Enterococcus huntleyi]|nr:hypothetical protein [Enterococcus sp. JM4C]